MTRFIAKPQGGTIYGTDWFDSFFGSSGDDIFYGLGGQDCFFGSYGSDMIDGGSGWDMVAYFYSDKGITITWDRDSEDGYSIGKNGHAEGDRLINIEAIMGTSYNDHIEGTDEANSLFGGGGDDHLIGHGGNDLLNGNAGSDTLDGGSGDDLFVLDMKSSDIVIGGDDTDTVNYSRSHSGVSVNLTSGTATILPNPASDRIDETSHTDSLSGIENIVGSYYSDSLFGDDGNNLFDGGAGADFFFGLDGLDTVTYERSSKAVFVSLASLLDEPGTVISVARGGDATGDQFSEIESLIGSDFDDVFIGNNSINYLYGGKGNDTLFGNSGTNLLNGGEGADNFVFDFLYYQDDFFTAAANNHRTIIDDFENGIDTIRTNQAFMTDADGNLDLTSWRQDGDDVVLSLSQNVIIGPFIAPVTHDVLRLSDMNLADISQDHFEIVPSFEFA
ncbi:MAG: calcium-binding protein [Candidatus Puniceispirillaceae bacterium]